MKQPKAALTGRRVLDEDKIIGQRFRELREVSGISRVSISHSIGVSVQQLQKYEAGLNRIGVGRLMQISRCLNVPITEFFVGLEGPVAPKASNEDQERSVNAAIRALGYPIADRLLNGFLCVKDSTIREGVLGLADASRANSGKGRSVAAA